MGLGTKNVLGSSQFGGVSVRLMTEPSARYLSANNAGPSKQLSAAIKRSLDRGKTCGSPKAAGK